MNLLRTVSSVLLLCGLVACGSSPPVHYYTLQSTQEGTEQERVAVPVTAVAPQGAVVGIGTIQLPAYLDRLPIVQRDGAALTFDNTQRWAEPLADAVPRVLAANLAAQLPGHRIVQQPWTSSGKPDWKLTLHVERFEAESGQVVLQANWSLLDAEGRVAGQRKARFSQPCEAGDTAAVAAAHSAALAAFSAALAADIRALTDR